MDRSIWIGFDPREADAYAVARHSIQRKLTVPIPIRPVILGDMQEQGLYTRETIRQNGLLFDVISEHPMATEFAISRFLVPHLVRTQYSSGRSPVRWALFMDCDMLIRTNLDMLFSQADPSKAVMVVKHNFRPPEGTKMDGQVQTVYNRKNWSSVMLFNVDHPANKDLTVELVNSVPGRDLHAFCWLKDHDIGELDVKWNYLIGWHSVRDSGNPGIVHFTDGIPTMPGYENSEYADEWQLALREWARR